MCRSYGLGLTTMADDEVAEENRPGFWASLSRPRTTAEVIGECVAIAMILAFFAFALHEGARFFERRVCVIRCEPSWTADTFSRCMRACTGEE